MTVARDAARGPIGQEFVLARTNLSQSDSMLPETPAKPQTVHRRTARRRNAVAGIMLDALNLFAQPAHRNYQSTAADA
jgi:hypothetical protein